MSSVFATEGVRRLRFGQGASADLAAEVHLLAKGPVLVVVDPGVLEAGVAAPALDSLKKARIKYQVFSGITREPEPSEADAAAALGRDMGAKVVVGIGGGSAMDLAKAAAVLITNDGPAVDYVGLDLVKKPGRPSIMLPTTAGTGSEVTFTAVFTRRADGFKGGINGRQLYPSTAILDPLLTVSCPAYITAITGMDALTHAMEAYTSRAANPISEFNSLRAIELIGNNLRSAVGHGGNIEARENMMLGSYLAGLALAQAGVGAVHAMAYPLGAMYDIPHGEANALLLPFVLRFNLLACVEKMAHMGYALADLPHDANAHRAADICVEEVFTLCREVGIPATLEQINIPTDSIAAMAEKAMTVAKPIENNPRQVTAHDLEQVYRQAFVGP